MEKSERKIIFLRLLLLLFLSNAQVQLIFIESFMPQDQKIAKSNRKTCLVIILHGWFKQSTGCSCWTPWRNKEQCGCHNKHTHSMVVMNKAANTGGSTVLFLLLGKQRQLIIKVGSYLTKQKSNKFSLILSQSHRMVWVPLLRAGTSTSRWGFSEPCTTSPGVFLGMGHPPPL